MSFDPDAPALPGSGLYGLDGDPDAAQVVVVPVPFGATQSYGVGANRGPQAVLTGSHQVDLFDLETGHPYEAGIALDPVVQEIVDLDKSATARAQKVIAAGGVLQGDLVEDLAAVNQASERINTLVYERTQHWLKQGKVVGVLGGDHAIPLGAIRAHAEHYGSFGILHLDAHADLRPAYEGFVYSHASIMERVLAEIPEVQSIVQVGLRDLGAQEFQAISVDPRLVPYFDVDLARARMQGRLLESLNEAARALPENVYLSFDIDGLDPALCPSTGTPVPGGLSLQEVSFLLEAVVRSGRTILGFDLCEVAETEDGGTWDGNVGARLLYKMIGWSLLSREGETTKDLLPVG